MVSNYYTTLARISISVLPGISGYLYLFWESLRAIGLVSTPSNPSPITLIDCVLSAMAPVVRIKPHGAQTLLLFDIAREDFVG
jgi:hypothetical protein